MQGKLGILILLLSLLTVSAQDQPPGLPASGHDIIFHIKDADTGKLITQKPIIIIFSKGNDQTRSVQIIDSEGTVKSNIETGEYKVLAEINEQDSPGSDLFGMADVNISDDMNLTIYMMPVGSVSGIVLSDNRTIDNSKIMLRCPSSYYDMGEFYKFVKTDEFGSFTLKYVPAGNCEIFSSSDSKSGSVKFTIKEGELKIVEIDLMLPKTESQPMFATMQILMIISAFLLVGIVVYKKYFLGIGRHRIEITPKREKKISTASSQPEMKVTKKMAGILQTLNENERNIVKFLIQNNGKGRQNRIYHALLIPKVTLSRAIFSLENKNIIKSVRLGKVKELELTKWFIE